MEIDNLDKLTALGHAGRMGVFRLLMRRYPDAVSAGEIAVALSHKASTLSVYLSSLSGVGLIDQTKQGTSRLYRIRMQAVQDLAGFVFEDCCKGRISTDATQTCWPSGMVQNAQRSFNVLFVCTGNSARSIFAEAILRREGQGRFNVFSAGVSPFSDVNKVVRQILMDRGHDVAPLRPKTLAGFQQDGAPVMDFVFTVCDQAANEGDSTWQGQPVSGHWGLPDPVAATGTDAEKYLAFQHTYTALHNRIKAFTALRFETLDRRSLQNAIDVIARTEDKETE